MGVGDLTVTGESLAWKKLRGTGFDVVDPEVMGSDLAEGDQKIGSFARCDRVAYHLGVGRDAHEAGFGDRDTANMAGCDPTGLDAGT